MIKRPNETVIQFSVRLIRNEILEQAVKAVFDSAKGRSYNDVIYNGAIDDAIDVIRALQQE